METKGTNNPLKDGSYKRIFSAFYKKWLDISNRIIPERGEMIGFESPSDH